MRSFALLAVALWNIVSLSVASAAAPPMSFEETVIPLITTFSIPQDSAVADLDHTNGPDIVVLGHHGDLAVLLNQGNGTFASPQYIASPCSIAANSVVVGQFNADTNPDILVACDNNVLDGFKRLRGNGDGTFQDPDTLAPIESQIGGGATIELVRVGQYGGEGQALTYRQFLGGATGTELFCFFRIPELIADFDAGGTFTPHCSFDFDPNGDIIDLFAIRDTYALGTPPFPSPDPAAFTFLADGTFVALIYSTGIPPVLPGFNTEAYVPTNQVTGASVTATGDLDGDGIPEVFALTGENNFVVYTVEPSQPISPGFRQIADPQVVTTDAAHGTPADVAVADFNGDGKPDVAVLADIGDGDTGTIEIYPGNGDGTFGAAQNFATDSDSGRLTVVDLEGTGLPDLVNLNRGARVVTIQRNTTPTSPNQPPTCSSGSAAVFAGNALNGSVTCADSDTGDSITVSAVAGPSHGSLTVNPDGTFTYAPNAGFAGSDSFTFKATDSHGAPSTVATESIVVNNTPLGTNVLVAPDPNVQVTFAGVSALGLTQAASSPIGPALPSGFEAAGLYWDITTTATFTPPVEVCIAAPGVASPRLFHATGGVFMDVTTRVAPPFVCGTVSSLSPFVVSSSCGQMVATKPKPKLRFAAINSDPKVGNDSFSLRGEFAIPGAPPFSAIDPRANGARIVVESGAGEVRIDASLPGGSFAGRHTRGWKLSNKGNVWTYVDATGSAIDGITHLVIVDKSKKAAGRVLVSVSGAKSTYAVVPGDVPLLARVVLGGQRPGEDDLCGQTAFGATDCQFDRKQNAVTCQTP